MNLVNYFIAFVRLILAMSTMLCYYIWFRLRKPFKSDPIDWGLEVQRRYAHLALKIFGTKHRLTGTLYDGPALYVSNHRSLLDPVVIRYYIRALGVAKAEVQHYPILGKAVEGTGIIFVQREDRNSRHEAKNSIVKSLEEGYSVMLFPEGTVSGEVTTLPFKKGSFEKAVEAGVPVIPITLIYNDAKYHWYNISALKYYFQSFGRHTPDVQMMVGKPIRSTNPNELMHEAQRVINGNLVATE